MRHRHWLHCCGIPIFVVMGILALTCSWGMAAGFDVIVNKSVPETELSRSELQSIFLGEKVRWSNRKYIKISVIENSPAQAEFLRSIVGKTTAQFDQHWMRLMSTGRGLLPPSFSDEQQLVDFVAKQPTAIGIISTGRAYGSVKVITVK